MVEFLEAIVQTLHNIGVTDAQSDGVSVILRGIRFELRTLRYRRSFVFCGRTYRSGNVKQAVLDMLAALPALLLRLELAQEVYLRDHRLRLLNKELDASGLKISRLGNSFQLTYTADLDRCEEIAKQIVSAESVSFASLDLELSKLSATFTSEGGFSLN